ncbi:MAG TPA: hypothetical protein DCP10_07360, partial [Bacteroidales bacterium]|nr:hypothetical protein [Bacteroidales bacterium]
KAMMNGRVLYRDIFDQRGPLLYFLYGLAYLISNTSFIGVYIFEVIFFSIFLYYSFKILSLYLDKDYALIAIPLLAAAVLNLKSFSHGGSPEEFCLPMVAMSLFTLLNYFKNEYPDPISTRQLLLNGFIAGCVLWIKFSFLGFWFGWMVSILIGILINKQVNKAIKVSQLFILGMIAATLPWLIYFWLNHSIGEWINSYFVVNLTRYSQTNSLLSVLQSTVLGLLRHLAQDPIIIGFLFFGIIVFVSFKRFFETGLSRFGILSCFSFLSLSVFGGGRNFVYYLMIFSPFLVFLFTVLFTHIYEKFGLINNRKSFLIIIFISFITSILYLVQFNHNTYMLGINKDELVQYKFASIINQKEDSSLLNYGTLDLGFYTTTGVIPRTRFFQNQNINYAEFPLVLDEQNRYIKEGLIDYVIIALPVENCDEELDIPHLYENYRLIESAIQKYEGVDACYLLFERNISR